MLNTIQLTLTPLYAATPTVQRELPNYKLSYITTTLPDNQKLKVNYPQ